MTEPVNRTLAELLAAGPLQYSRFLTFATQVSRQLERMHADGKAHGQISPASIVLSTGDECRLIPPETYLEGDEQHVREDLYQVGLLFTQMLVATGGGAGNRPIHPIVSEHTSLGEATALVPVEARLLLDELLAEDPRDRIATARELSSTVAEMQDLSRMPVEPSVPERPDRTRLYFVFAMTILIALVVWVFLEVYHKL